METAVMVSSPAIDFNFDSSSCTSPYMSAPSSPPRFGTPFFSAPTSPTHRISSSSSASASALLYITSASISNSLSAVPFNWEEKPGLPKSSSPTQPNENDDENFANNNKDFAFDFSGQLDKHYLPADELFDGGKIKPLKPPPCLNYESSPKSSPRSPKKTFKETFSPRSTKRRDFDPFAEAFKNTSMEESQMGRSHFQRGRERKNSDFDSFSNSNTTTTTTTSCTPIISSIRHNKTRSLSPFRVSDLLFDQETEQQQKTDNKTSNSSSTSSSSSSSSSWYKKWKIKDLLLFRSASEGRPSSKAQLKKYALLKKTSNNNNNNNINEDDDDDDSKNMSFRSVDSSVGSSSVINNTTSCSSRRRSSSGLISAHELHYTINRAVSEEMKKKTFLPYKQGLLGCLGFQPAPAAAAGADISRGVGSMTR